MDSSMSRIVLLIDDVGDARVQVVKLLRKQLQVNIGHIAKALAEKGVLLEQELFPRDDSAFPERLIGVLESLDTLRVSYSFFEIPGSDSFSKERRESYYRVTTKRLRSIMEARKESLDWAWRQAWRESDE